MDNRQQQSGATSRKKMRRYLGFTNANVNEDTHLVHTLLTMLTPWEVEEVVSLLRTMPKTDRVFVAKFVSYVSKNVAIYRGNAKAIFNDLLICCRIAHLMATQVSGDYLPSFAFMHTKGIATSVKYILKFPAAHLDWNNREVLNCTYGTTLLAMADRLGQASYEDMMWLGENHEKMIPLIPHMKEVSCERGYLETLLDNEVSALWRGAL